MLQQTFLQKVVLMIFMGFMAACGIYVFRHVVLQAFYETGEGWKDSLYRKPAAEGIR